MPADDRAIQRVREAAAAGGITLDIRVFDVSTHTAAEAAAAVGAELGQIVKSLVFVGDAPGDVSDGRGDPVICLVSGPNRVDLRRLAAAVGADGIRRATAAEARELTGYPIGGIPPFGHARPVTVVMDPDLEGFELVWAAAGTDRAVFPISPSELARLSGAVVAPIAAARDGAPGGDPAPAPDRVEAGAERT